MADFNLYTDSSLIDYLDPTCPIAVNPDGSGGTPVDGGTARYWGGGKGVIAATTNATLGGADSLTPPIYSASLIGGLPGLTFAAGKGLSLGQPSALTTPLNAASPQFTAIVACRPTSAPAQALALTKTAAGQPTGRLALGIASPSGELLALPALGQAGQPIAINQFVVMSVAYEFGTNARGCQKTSVLGFGGYGSNGAGSADAASDFMISGQNWSTSPYTFQAFPGDIVAVYFFSGYLAEDEIKAATDQIHTLFGQPYPDAGMTDDVAVTHNSEIGITGTTRKMTALLGGQRVHWLGWGGETGDMQVQRLQSDAIRLWRYLRPFGRRKIGGTHEITNDLATGRTPEVAAANQRTVLTAVKPWVDYTFGVTSFDRNPGSFSRDKLQVANDYLRAFPSAVMDGICDLAGTLPDAEDSATVIDVFGDGVHLVDPYGLDPFLDKLGAAIRAGMAGPTATATDWGLSPPSSTNDFSRHAGGQTTGNFHAYPILGLASGVTATVSSSNASDAITSTDASWVGSGNSGTLTWGSTGDDRWKGRPFAIKWGSTTGARTISLIVGGVTKATATITPTYTGANTLILRGVASGTAKRLRGSGVESPIMAVKTGTGGSAAGLASGASGAVTITPSAGAVTVKSGSTTFNDTSSEVVFTITPTPGTASPITITITNSITGATIANPAVVSYYFEDGTPTITLSAPPATAPNTTNAADSCLGFVRCTGLQAGQTRTVTLVDSLGGTFIPPTLTFGPAVTYLTYRLAAGSPAGARTISATSTGDGTYSDPTPVSYTNNAGPLAGPLGFTAINPTSFTVTSPTPTGGTGPFTYLFEYAPETAGAIPGTWTSIAAASSSQSATKTGLTAGARIFVRCTVTGSASLTSTSPIYDFVTSDLTAGTTTTGSVTSTTVTETTTGGVGGFGSLVYQAQTAADVAGSPGAFGDYGSPGASKTAVVSGLAPSTAGWYRFKTTDSHPLAPASVFDAAVTATTLADSGSGGEYDYKNQGYAMSTSGDYGVGQIVAANFGTTAALVGGAVAVYRAASTAKSTAGVTLTAGLDSIAGYNAVSVDTSADPSFYQPGYDYDVVFTAGTVSGTAQAGKSILSFSLRNRIEPVKSLPLKTSSIKGPGG